MSRRRQSDRKARANLRRSCAWFAAAERFVATPTVFLMVAVFLVFLAGHDNATLGVIPALLVFWIEFALLVLGKVLANRLLEYFPQVEHERACTPYITPPFDFLPSPFERPLRRSL